MLTVSQLNCFTLLILGALGQRVLDLSGKHWTLKDSNGSISVPAQVPSQAYLDLYRNGIVDDPLYGLNNVNEQWVERTNWTYSTTIHGINAGRGTQTLLVFEGLDTFAYVELCGKAVGNTNNQFRQFIFDVSHILSSCRGPPELSINFGSATQITHAIADTVGDGTVNFVNSCKDGPGNEYSCKIYARKEANDFGWDWSPSLAPAGPWRPIYLVEINSRGSQVYVNNAFVDIYRKGQQNNLPPDQSQPWVFNASIDFVGKLPRGASLELELSDSANRKILQRSLSGVYSNNTTITGSTTIDPSIVQLWWPSGLGQQPLYNARVSIIQQSGRTGWSHRRIASVQRRVGFRTIVLNLEPISEEQEALGIAPGANWHFEINGKEFYAKGSNLVPPDTFWPRVNETHIRHLFELVKQGNQNMLRVWSSGAYLDDWIYDIADEMGILLWSEFEFSDAEYPTAQDYLENYQAEAYYNIRRLNSHASLALWVGGNELENILLAYFFNPDTPGQIQQQYTEIFEELLIKCVYANTKSISYIPSSTYRGYLDLSFNSVRPQIPRYNNRSSADALYQDTENYNSYAPTVFDQSTYPVGRFAVEFGIISMPSLQSWNNVADNPTSFADPVVLNHNRHVPFGASGTPEENSAAGIAEMTDGVKLWYPQPQISDPRANFSAWIWSTQVYQADYISTEIAFYRRGSGMPERQLGSLYWQLDDLWVAPTWSSIESNGRQKVFYYAAKDIYQPVIIRPYYNTSTHDLQVWVTSDRFTAVSGTVHYQWVDWSGKVLSIGTSRNSSNSTGQNMNAVPFKVGPVNATRVLQYADVISTLNGSSINATNALLYLSVTGSDGSQSYTHSSFFHPVSLAKARIRDPGLSISIGTSSRQSPGYTQPSGNVTTSVQVTVTATRAVAAWVWLDYSSAQVQGYWSDNGFWLNKGETRTVTFFVWNDWTGSGGWTESVTVRSMWDNIAGSSNLTTAST